MLTLTTAEIRWHKFAAELCDSYFSPQTQLWAGPSVELALVATLSGYY